MRCIRRTIDHQLVVVPHHARGAVDGTIVDHAEEIAEAGVEAMVVINVDEIVAV